jgi:hypothetical protein
VVGDLGVTPVTGVVGIAAGKPDGDDIALDLVVGTSGLVVDVDATDRLAVDFSRWQMSPWPQKHTQACHSRPP